MTRVYFDNKIQFYNIKNKYIIYSPSNHRWFATDKYIYDVLRYVVYNNGIINEYVKTLYEYYSDQSVYNNFKDLLLKTGVFFSSNKEYKKSINDFHRLSNKRKQFNPKVAFLMLTSKCNYNCKFCINERIVNKNTISLPTEKWELIISKLHNVGVTDYIFTGGEVLLRDDISSLVNLIYRKYNGNITIITNGSLLTRSIIDDLLPCIKRVIISIDTISKCNEDNQVKMHNCFLIQDKLKYLSEKYPDKVEIRTVVTKDNINSLNTIKEYISNNFGFKYHSFVRMEPRTKTDIVEIPNDEIVVNNNFMLKEIIYPNKYKPCSAADGIIAIDEKGDIYPCQTLYGEGKMKMGSMLLNNWINEVKNSYAKKTFDRLYVDNVDVCKTCTLRYFCGGSCPALSYKIFGVFNKYLPFSCDDKKNIAKLRMVCTKLK